MGRPTKAAVEERRARVAQLLKGGATQSQIAKSLNVSLATANTDVTAILEGWRETQRDAIADARALDLQRINDLMLAFTPGARSGDSSAGRVFIQLLERRAALLGLDAPKRTDTHVSGQLRTGPSVEELILAAREARTERLAADADRILAETNEQPAMIEAPKSGSAAEQAIPPPPSDRDDAPESKAARFREAARQDRGSGPLHY